MEIVFFCGSNQINHRFVMFSHFYLVYFLRLRNDRYRTIWTCTESSNCSVDQVLDSQLTQLHWAKMKSTQSCYVFSLVSWRHKFSCKQFLLRWMDKSHSSHHNDDDLFIEKSVRLDGTILTLQSISSLSNLQLHRSHSIWTIYFLPSVNLVAIRNCCCGWFVCQHVFRVVFVHLINYLWPTLQTITGVPFHSFSISISPWIN